MRVSDADETADAVQQANRALVEIRFRDAADESKAAEHRAEELTRWRTDDQTAGQTAVDDAAEREPVALDNAML